MSRGRAEHDLDLDPTEPWTCVYLPGRGSTHPKEQPRQGQCVILRALGGAGRSASGGRVHSCAGPEVELELGGSLQKADFRSGRGRASWQSCSARGGAAESVVRVTPAVTLRPGNRRGRAFAQDADGVQRFVASQCGLWGGEGRSVLLQAWRSRL